MDHLRSGPAGDEQFVLGARARSAGYGLSLYGAVSSTNDLALEAATLGDRGPRWFVAASQTSGRGRSGRVWSSPPGNLCATLLVDDPCPQKDLPKLGFVTGVALRSAIRTLSPGLEGVALKWPNDLLIDGAKAAGILLETRVTPSGRQAVAIGVGVNCISHPLDTPYRATDLSACGVLADARSVLRAFSDQMAAELDRFARAQGFATIRAAWIEGAHGIGAMIETRLGGGIQRGVFAGIDESGRLLLRSQSRLQAIDAADLFFSF